METRQCLGQSTMEVEPNQLITVKLKGNNKTFVILKEAIRSEIGVCGCHGPPALGGLVELTNGDTQQVTVALDLSKLCLKM